MVDLPPIMNEATDPWVCNIVRNGDGIIIVIDISEDPQGQIDLIMEQCTTWKIDINGMENIAPNTEGVVRKNAIIVANKYDLIKEKGWDFPLEEQHGSIPVIPVSISERYNLDLMKRETFNMLNIIRVYSKAPNKSADLSRPYILKKGSRLIDLADEIHKDFSFRLKYARIWAGDKYSGQKIPRDFQLRDGDIIELHI
jgi:hypothetical protein